jgi:hypothetical protein
METVKLSLIPRTEALSLSEVAAVAGAIQEQVIEHFAPIWNTSAIIAALEEPEFGYIPIFIRDTINQPRLSGFHTVEKDGSPYAVVQYGPTWSLPASHECLEMIIDPKGYTRIPGILPGITPTPVEYVLEVCDPCQSLQCAYTISKFRCLISIRHIISTHPTPQESVTAIRDT